MEENKRQTNKRDSKVKGTEKRNKSLAKKKKKGQDEGATVVTPASWLFQLHSHLFAKGLSRPPCVCSGRLIAFPSSSLFY